MLYKYVSVYVHISVENTLHSYSIPTEIPFGFLCHNKFRIHSGHWQYYICDTNNFLSSQYGLVRSNHCEV